MSPAVHTLVSTLFLQDGHVDLIADGRQRVAQGSQQQEQTGARVFVQLGIFVVDEGMTIKLGGLMVLAVGVVATLVKLL